MGHEVTLVNNGHEAVDAYSNGTFDLILMDILMPVMDGYAAAAAIRRRDEGSSRSTPIVALTALASPEESARCLEAGMETCMLKPITPFSLRATLDRFERPEDKSAAPSARADFRHRDMVKEFFDCGDLVRQVIRSFQATCPGLLTQIEQGLINADRASVAQCCHGLRGAAAAIMADQLENSCLELEELVESGELAKAQHRFQGLVEDWSRLRAALDALD